MLSDPVDTGGPAQGDEDEAVARVRNQVADSASNRASYRPENAESVADDAEP